MALTCEEHVHKKHGFSEKDLLLCVTTSSTATFAPVCAEIIRKIPREERSGKFPGGIDIHRGHSKAEEPGGELTQLHFAMGDYLFSVSRATALRYFPNLMRNRQY